MTFRQWPSWLQCGMAFVVMYILIASSLFAWAYIKLINADPLVDDYAALRFIYYIYASFPGWLVHAAAANSIIHPNILSKLLIYTAIPAVSLCIYFLLGAGIGTLIGKKGIIPRHVPYILIAITAVFCVVITAFWYSMM